MTFKDERFLKALQKHIKGEARSDPINRSIYSVDASIYEILPQVIVIPSSKEDLLTTISIAGEHGIPVTPRGAATGITGGCLGTGVILDLSKSLNKILEINLNERYAVCQPGVIQNQLNEAISKEGLRLGPDTSTGDRATLGGMFANNAAGAHSLKYGTMADHIHEVELALADGTCQTFTNTSQNPLSISEKILKIRHHYYEDIHQHYPKIPRITSGYNLKALIEGKEPHLAKLIAGSEGTLGIATAIKVALAPKLESTALCLIGFKEIGEGMTAIQTILSWKPIALEMIDHIIIETGRSSPLMRGKLNWLMETPKIVLAIEFEDINPIMAAEKAQALAALSLGVFSIPLITAKEQGEFWELRKSGLGLLLSKRSYSRAIAFIEDLSIAPENLEPFMEEFLVLLKKHKKEAGIYGHAGAGCLHIRPYINLQDPEEKKLMQRILEETAALVLKWKGALSGEHGDGLVRSWLNPRQFGDKLSQAFVEIKEAFDPNNLMNPGKIVHGPPFLEHLRKGPSFEPPTFLDFSKEGGLALSADLCNGNGLCRKKEKTMCPSFQATSDEYHTTRARAQTLRAIMQENLPKEEWTGKGLYDVLDLCLQCKGCKTECPSQVDMAKMKAEFLHHYYQKHRRPLRDYLFGYIGRLNWLNSWLPNFSNFVFSRNFFKKIQKMLGISSKRVIPKIASETFSKWAKKRLDNDLGKAVVLFIDTFTEFNCKEVGMAAVKVLESLGYCVIIPPWQCCGRPLISKGMLKPAKKYAEKVVAQLLPYAEQNIPIIGLEPSCLFTLKDDYQGLLGYGNDALQKVIQNCVSFDHFVASQNVSLASSEKEFIFHGHCHQKALEGTEKSLAVLKQIGTASEIASGCCGMAGSFGYESEHHALSIQIGELKLFPTIRGKAKKTVIIANGFSCRSQIQEGTGKKALHIAEALADSLK